jgi:hypothetical protein
MPQPQLKPIEERDPYAEMVLDAFDRMERPSSNPECKLCEFEKGWGYPFCRGCGKEFPENSQEPHQETEPERMTVSRSMAMDAGMPEIEGMQI